MGLFPGRSFHYLRGQCHLLKIHHMKLKYIYFIIASVVIFSSCRKDFEEIDTNPQGFTTAGDGPLFNGIVQSLLPTWNEQFYVNNEILYAQTQQAALTKATWGNFTQ